MGKKSEIDVDERREIVLKMLRKEESTASLARKHDVAEASLH
jgi:transposase-like protein